MTNNYSAKLVDYCERWRLVLLRRYGDVHLGSNNPDVFILLSYQTGL